MEDDNRNIEPSPCLVCGKNPTDPEFGMCGECADEGYWIDPAGGIHGPNDNDPAKMYE